MRILIVFLLPLLMACSATKTNSMNETANTLTETERAEGWELLFDGASTKGWHTYGKPDSIGRAWQVEDSSIHLNAAAKKDWQTAEGGDIVTANEYDNFHLKLDWKIAKNGNSGIMFYVKEDPIYPYPWHTGPEMQVLDNAGHPDAKITTHRAGDLYDLMSSKETVRPAMEWNHVEIISNNNRLQFFLNGEEVLQTSLWDENWRAMIARSKFKDMPAFGTFRSGRISLQDHGDDVWFRNIKIRRL
jgi:hypothetical protein